jgi:hypothetical protein
MGFTINLYLILIIILIWGGVKLNYGDRLMWRTGSITEPFTFPNASIDRSVDSAAASADEWNGHTPPLYKLQLTWHRPYVHGCIMHTCMRASHGQTWWNTRHRRLEASRGRPEASYTGSQRERVTLNRFQLCNSLCLWNWCGSAKQWNPHGIVQAWRQLLPPFLPPFHNVSHSNIFRIHIDVMNLEKYICLDLLSLIWMLDLHCETKEVLINKVNSVLSSLKEFL